MNDFPALPAAADYNVAPSLGPHDPHAGHENPFEIFQRIHRLLRGRYHYAFILGAIGAIAGALGGYKATVPKYQAVGMIRVKAPPTKVYVLPENQGQSGSATLHTIAQYLQHPRVLDKAMLSTEWKAVGRGLSDDAKDEFKESLRVDTDPGGSEWIYVKFTDVNPKVAKVGAEQVMLAYIDLYSKEDTVVYPGLIPQLQNQVRSYESEVAGYQTSINAISSNFGTPDLDALLKDGTDELKDLEHKYSQLELQIKLAEAAEAAPNAGPPPAPAEVNLEAAADEMARTDDNMHALLKSRSDAELYLQQILARGFTEEHPTVKRLRGSIAGMTSQIHSLAQKWLDQHGGIAMGAENPLTRLSPDQLRAAKVMFETITTRRDTLRQHMVALNNARLQIADLTEKIKKTKTEQADVEHRLTQLTTESSATDASGSSGRINIISTGEEPHRPSVDNRKKLAALGFIFGGGIPVGLVLLWGLFDRRYRYSDDASSGSIHPTLLGILPFLPEDMSDPEQAGIAAHCVHQIRTLLQITAAQTGKRVFAVTSPTSGDGKTSLSMSLALSFASSGANTCLIDFDLIGGGLSSAMNAKTDVGLMDAIEHAELNGQIRPTGFKRLSIVPAGRDDAALVATLSPDSVRLIIKQAREKFDVVIIDTGPILGSLEASLVTSAADGVILALGRGQARALADRAMRHLISVGATLMGVVFNRAQPGDFKRAISSASVRSVPNQGGASPAEMRALPALGPMARTVARHVRPTDSGGPSTHDH